MPNVKTENHILAVKHFSAPRTRILETWVVLNRSEHKKMFLRPQAQWRRAQVTRRGHTAAHPQVARTHHVTNTTKKSSLFLSPSDIVNMVTELTPGRIIRLVKIYIYDQTDEAPGQTLHLFHAHIHTDWQ